MPASSITPEFDLMDPVTDGTFRKRRIEEARVVAPRISGVPQLDQADDNDRQVK